VFSVASAVLPYVKTLFKGLIIVALQFYIGLKPLLKSLGLIGSTAKGSGDGTKTLANAMTKVGEVAGYVTNVFAKFLAHKSTLIAIGIAVGLIVLPFVLLQGILLVLTAVFVALLAVGAAAMDWLLNLGQAAWDAGTSLVDGLINGVTAAGSKLVDTVKNLAGDALKAFKSVFKIQSPSRVMMGVGENITLGLAQGIASGGKAVNDNMTAVVDPIAPPRTKTDGANASGPVSAPTTFDEGSIVVNIYGVENAEDLEVRMPEIMGNVIRQALNGRGQTAA
jgi:hypothetical protein